MMLPDEWILSVACDSFGTPTMKRHRLKGENLCDRRVAVRLLRTVT
jgi:hypothetical protein